MSSTSVSFPAFSGQYVLAFWFVMLSIISGLGAVAKAIANPDWYAEGRARAVLETHLSRIPLVAEHPAR